MKAELFDLNGKVAIVTGGNGGIGLGMARGLAAAGARWRSSAARSQVGGRGRRTQARRRQSDIRGRRRHRTRKRSRP